MHAAEVAWDAAAGFGSGCDVILSWKLCDATGRLHTGCVFGLDVVCCAHACMCFNAAGRLAGVVD